MRATVGEVTRSGVRIISQRASTYFVLCGLRFGKVWTVYKNIETFILLIEECHLYLIWPRYILFHLDNPNSILLVKSQDPSMSYLLQGKSLHISVPCFFSSLLEQLLRTCLFTFCCTDQACVGILISYNITVNAVSRVKN